MQIADNDIVKRLQSKTVSKSEFKFDNMFSRPLSTFLSQWDIDRLYAIASSIRYAGNARKKFKAIDEVMEPRGFIELSAGTNRICYRHREDDSIVVKVAYNDVGRKDNPAEFVNQNYLKPFCSKVFEVSSDGTVALDERVKPIKSREEFISIADDIFAICWMFTQKYILADFGSKYFMNWGTRYGFGPVILDYSYLYEVDGDKLICKAPDPNSPGGVCGGLIDYDEGFNHLKCNKCGATYRAIEIAKAIKTNEIIRNFKEDKKMRVGFMWNGNVHVSNTDHTEFNQETETIKKEVTKKKGVPTTNGIPKVRVGYVDAPVVKNKKKEQKNNKEEHKNIDDRNYYLEKGKKNKFYSKYSGFDKNTNIIFFKNDKGFEISVDLNSIPDKILFDIVGDNEELEETKHDLEKAENQIEKQNELITNLNSKIGDLKKDKDFQGEDYSKLKNDFELKEIESNNKDTVIDELKETIKTLTKENEEYKETINVMTDNHNKLYQELIDKDNKNKELEKELSNNENPDIQEIDNPEFPDGICFVTGEVYKLSDIAEDYGFETPKDRSKYVLWFTNPDGSILSNDNGKIVCVDKLSGTRIDNIEFSIKKDDEDIDDEE